MLLFGVQFVTYWCLLFGIADLITFDLILMRFGLMIVGYCLRCLRLRLLRLDVFVWLSLYFVLCEVVLQFDLMFCFV